MAEKKEVSNKVTFVTQVHRGECNLKVIVKPSTPIYENGQRVGVKRGVKCDFKNGKYSTDNPEIIEALRQKSSYGKLFFETADPVKGEGVAAPSAVVDNGYEAMTVKELLAIAKEKKLPVTEGMRKPQLLELLKKQ